MEQLFDKYANIQLFITKYRKYSLIDGNFLDFSEFKNKIQLMGYVSHELEHKETDRKIDIYLFKKDSKFIKTTTEFNKLLYRYNEPREIILFTKDRLSIYLKKAVKKHHNLTIYNYLHKYFIMEMNKGPLCSKHTILSIEEAKDVCFDLMTHGHKLPAIYVDDPQNIWIGGKINDIIKIEAFSELTGKTVRYRIVVPSTGRDDSSVVIKKINIPSAKLESVEESTEPVEEDIVEDDEDYEDNDFEE
jgi:DNA-directed RNA polymerase subunit H (RpoH/RPB5)